MMRHLCTATPLISLTRTGNPSVAVLSLNRPQVKNALNASLLAELSMNLREIRSTPSIRFVILNSTDPRVFCAGADLKERIGMSLAQVQEAVNRIGAAVNELEALPVPTIALMEGVALGGGLELALGCDFRVCSNETVMGLPETSLAIIPGAGGTVRLPRLIGMSRAKELIYTGRRIKGHEALELGIVDYCVERGEEMSVAMSLAEKIIRNGPVAIEAAKYSMNNGVDMDKTTALKLESLCYGKTLPTKDREEGLKAFKEKRSPEYTGA